MINYLFLVVLVLIALASLPLWWMAIQRVRCSPGSFPSNALLPPRQQIESPIGLFDVLLTFLFWTVLQAVCLLFILQVMDLDQADLAEPAATQSISLYAVMAAGQLLTILLTLAWIALRYRHVLQIFGCSSRFFATDLKLATCAFVMTVPSLLLLQWLFSFLVDYRHGTIEILKDQNNLLTVLVTWTAAVVLAPLAEEIFFRGFLQSWLQRMGHGKHRIAASRLFLGGFSGIPQAPGGDLAPNERQTAGHPLVLDHSQAGWMPIILTSAAFGAVHLGQGLAPLILFLFSIVLGFLYRQTGSILLCIVLHMLLNGYSMFWVTLDLFLGSSSNSL
ncbi:MAG: CPBP family glutamic-type intramembrane protease [Mariniblastus sp.]|nr:CPBP family glutamic-type intramembrane protease [Mariniblastus sp.]